MPHTSLGWRVAWILALIVPTCAVSAADAPPTAAMRAKQAALPDTPGTESFPRDERLQAHRQAAGVSRERAECGSQWYRLGAERGKAAAAVVAWLDWQLRGDRKAARMFVGKDCELCI